MWKVSDNLIFFYMKQHLKLLACGSTELFDLCHSSYFRLFSISVITWQFVLRMVPHIKTFVWCNVLDFPDNVLEPHFAPPGIPLPIPLDAQMQHTQQTNFLLQQVSFKTRSIIGAIAFPFFFSHGHKGVFAVLIILSFIYVILSVFSHSPDFAHCVAGFLLIFVQYYCLLQQACQNLILNVTFWWLYSNVFITSVCSGRTEFIWKGLL